MGLFVVPKPSLFNAPAGPSGLAFIVQVTGPSFGRASFDCRPRQRLRLDRPIRQDFESLLQALRQQEHAFISSSVLWFTGRRTFAP